VLNNVVNTGWSGVRMRLRYTVNYLYCSFSSKVNKYNVIEMDVCCPFFTPVLWCI